MSRKTTKVKDKQQFISTPALTDIAARLMSLRILSIFLLNKAKETKPLHADTNILDMPLSATEKLLRQASVGFLSLS